MIKVKIVKISADAIMPKYATNQDAGCDLCGLEDVVLKPGERISIKTGIKMEIPIGYYGRVAPRSGLAFKNGIDTLAGVIDAGYRGEIAVIIINHGKEDFKIEKGNRIAQMIFEKIDQAEFEEVEELNITERGDGGFGSSGIK